MLRMGRPAKLGSLAASPLHGNREPGACRGKERREGRREWREERGGEERKKGAEIGEGGNCRWVGKKRQWRVVVGEKE